MLCSNFDQLNMEEGKVCEGVNMKRGQAHTRTLLQLHSTLHWNPGLEGILAKRQRWSIVKIFRMFLSDVEDLPEERLAPVLKPAVTAHLSVFVVRGPFIIPVLDLQIP